MYEVDELLVEEVRKYEHLYCNATTQYKDTQMVRNTWKKISQDIGIEEIECTRRWRSLRDKYVRLRKRLVSQGVNSASEKLPPFYNRMMWLAPHVTHRRGEESRRCHTRTPRPVRKVNVPTQQSFQTGVVWLSVIKRI